MNKFWIVIVMLLSVTLMASNPVKANDILITAEIYREIAPKRTSGIPGAIDRTYTWKFENKEYTALIAIDRQWYNKIRNDQKKRRYNHHHFSSMVYKGVESLEKLIKEFNRVIPRTWSEERRVNFVLAFVQAVQYTKDETTGYDEFYKYPTETLVEGLGDCEDSSILFAAILGGLNFKLALLLPPGHLAVGVKVDFRGRPGFWSVSYKNDKYYYCETTSPGWKLGMMPKRYENVGFEVMSITPNPVQPKLVRPRTVTPKPKLPSLPSPQKALENGKNLYNDTRYNEAIKSLQLALPGLNNSEQRAEAYIYLGVAEYTFETGNIKEAETKAKVRFQEALRQNPDQELPWRGHPKFEPLIKQVRRESIGELTVSASLPQTEIWISGNGINRKKLEAGTKPIHLRLFKGNYTVEGIYAGRSRERTIYIEPNTHKSLKIVIQSPPPTVDDIAPTIELVDPRRTADVNQEIQIMAEVTDNISVKSVYLFYAFSHSGTEPSKYNRISLTSILDIYFGDIPSQSKVGYIWYYLIATDIEGNQGKTKKRRLEIKPNYRETPLDNQPPAIALLSPPQVANVNQQIRITATVTDNIAIESAYLFYSLSHSPRSRPSGYDRVVLKTIIADRYFGDIPSQSEVGYIWYYLTATDIEGNNTRSEVRTITINTIKRDRPDTPPQERPKNPFISLTNKPIAHQGIWANYAWSSRVFEKGAPLLDGNRGDSINFTYLHEGKNHQTFGVQLDYSYQKLSNMSATFQWGSAVEENPIAFTLLGGVAGYSDFDSTRTSPTLSRRDPNNPIYITPILGVGLKLYPADGVSIDAICSVKFPANFDNTYLYHYEIGTRIYINDLLNLKLGYSQFHLGDGNLKRMQIGLGFTF